jgi:hypothetical protein
MSTTNGLGRVVVAEVDPELRTFVRNSVPDWEVLKMPSGGKNETIKRVADAIRTRGLVHDGIPVAKVVRALLIARKQELLEAQARIRSSRTQPRSGAYLFS